MLHSLTALLRRVGQTLPPRLRWYVLAVSAAGIPIVAGALDVAVHSGASSKAYLGIASFGVFAFAAELRPVPIDPAGNRDLSLAFVFIISVQFLFGWEWSVLVGTVGIGLAMAIGRFSPVKVLFNAFTYAIAAGLAALVGSLLHGTLGPHGYLGLVTLTIVCGAVFVIANVLLVCFAMSQATAGSARAIFSDHLQHSGPMFAIMIFVAGQAVIFWRLSPGLVLLLCAPIFALSLYQRSYVRSRTAEQEAATDSLTALKNRRAFEEEAERVLAAGGRKEPLSLCLIDIDHFKQVNDRHGHPTGDAVLELLAGAIDEVAPGRGYRLGGDELAFLVAAPGPATLEAAERIRALFRERQTEVVPEGVTISCGIAVFPDNADDLHSLGKYADLALYQSKSGGRDRSTIYVETENGRSVDQLMGGGFPLLDIRMVTARRLATLVDAFASASADAQGVLPAPAYTDVLDRWQSFDGSHSEAVASLSVALGRRLGLSREELHNVRLAALLHDIGKIAIPAAILSKPGPLTPTERDLIERHPVIGHELLRDLGLGPVDTYVLYHHERWDGGGYPAGLAGAEIPFGSRLILVADAFDALTCDRAYRNRVSVEAAMHELQSEAGRQLDPLVVAALHDHLAQAETEAVSHHGDDEPGSFAADLEPAWSF